MRRSLVLIACAWLAGLWLAARVQGAWWAWLALAGAAAAGLALAWRRAPRWRLPLGLALAVALAGARYAAAQPPWGSAAFVATYNDIGQVVLEGVVWDEPDVRDTRTLLRVRAERLTLPGADEPIAVSGLVLVQAPRYSAERLAATGEAGFGYGDRLRVTGLLETPPEFEGFSYRDYLARSGVHAQVRAARVAFEAAGAGLPHWQALCAFKARALNTLEQLFPEPHAALLAGILLGNESGLPEPLKEAFNATSTSHIIAISGFNIAVLAGFATALTRRWLGGARGAAAAVLVIAAYTVLVGASASVVRAAIMGGLALAARQVGRGGAALNTLAVAALAMTLINPHTLWDVGFQLSAAATLGLVLYARPFEQATARWLGRYTTAGRARRLASLAAELVLITLAAQVTTLPITLYYFERLSLVGMGANILILPAQPAVMVLGGLALMLGLAWLPLGQLAALAAWPFTAYTLGVVQLFARLPAASVPVGAVAPALVVVFYALLFGLTWVLQRPAPQRPAWWPAVAERGLPAGGLVALGAFTLLAWSWYFSLPPPDSRLRVTVLDVGQGDAVLIQAPGGATALVDGGPAGRVLAGELAERLPLFARELDLLVLAGPLAENVGGVPEVLERYAVRQAVLTGATDPTAPFRASQAALLAARVPVVPAAGRPTLSLGDGMTLSVVADTPEGSVLRLAWGRFALLLPVGVTADIEADLVAQRLAQPATALLLADNGSARANTAAWINAVNPQVVVISVGAGNAGGDPAPEVLARLTGRNVLRTDVHGAVTLETDGERLWVRVER